VAANSTETAEESCTYTWDIAFPLEMALEIGSVDIILFATVVGRDVFQKPLERVHRAYRFASGTAYVANGWNNFASTSWRPADAVVNQD
ncbi:MAG: hypothetical protein Q8R02_20015, partial [Hyphomonadaceae bacterium]|nr:hypothetical protein [Hyphomonadaceae bacterium]